MWPSIFNAVPVEFNLQREQSSRRMQVNTLNNFIQKGAFSIFVFSFHSQNSPMIAERK